MSLKNSKRMTRVGGVGGGGDGVTAESWADRSCGTEKLPSTSSVAKPPGEGEGSPSLLKLWGSGSGTRPPGSVSSSVKWVNEGLG